MPRQPHGHYAERRHLPNNSMQPVGTGIYVWFQQEILGLFPDEGEQLLLDASQQGTKRYAWLCEQLQALGHQEVVDSFTSKKREYDAAKRMDDRERRRTNLSARLANEQNAARQRYLQREIAKCDRYLAQRRTADKRN